jgi:hypothetical protein
MGLFYSNFTVFGTEQRRVLDTLQRIVSAVGSAELDRQAAEAQGAG